MKRHAVGLAILGLGAIGCATADVPATLQGTERILIRKADPPDGYVEVGPISATNGGGCGGFGERGTYEGAMAQLKNQALSMKADYVRLDLASEPHPSYGCFINEYAVRGVAFRRGAAAPASSSPPVNAAELTLAGRSDERLRAIGELVGQRVILHLQSGEVLAGMLAGVTPPDTVKLVLLDQSARSLRAAEIERLRLAPP